MELKINNLTIGYRGVEPLCTGINLEVHSGTAVAIIGDNGAGKSTLLRTIAAIHKHAEGEILLDNTSIKTMTLHQRATSIAFVSTEPIMAAYTTVEQIIALGRVPYSGWAGKLSKEDKEVVKKAMKDTKTTEFANRSINTLSDGQRQRVMIARALCQDTKMLILDEPTAFLDPKNRKAVIELLVELARNLQKIVIYSTHEVELAMLSGSKIWHLKNSQLNICT